MTIHWCGAGLSAIPGLRRLIKEGYDVIVWNRTLAKAAAAVGDITNKIRVFDRGLLQDCLKKGDIIVSMLPADWHVPLASLAISENAHFVSSSYIAPEMRMLDTEFKKANLVCINEVGLDPGIDHLMAHKLVTDYRQSENYNIENELSFLSYCGGIPKFENAFKYKFSWSPLGVLKALKSPSKSLRDFEEFNVARPWDAISTYEAPLEQAETFEVYPNRDSLPFLRDYKFDPAWKVKDFVRGTLRLNGWSRAWKDIFKEIEGLSGKAGDTRLEKMSDQFWSENAYDKNEPDRVVLCVSLNATMKNSTKWHKTFVMDAWGDTEGSAMSRLVSQPVSLAVEAVLEGKLEAGVQAAPNDIKIVDDWLAKIHNLAQYLKVIHHN